MVFEICTFDNFNKLYVKLFLLRICITRDAFRSFDVQGLWIYGKAGKTHAYEPMIKDPYE